MILGAVPSAWPIQLKKLMPTKRAIAYSSGVSWISILKRPRKMNPNTNVNTANMINGDTILHNAPSNVPPMGGVKIPICKTHDHLAILP